jgi:hypothetical protein
MKLVKRLAILAGSSLATMGLASGAAGYFTASGTAEGAAQVGTVAPPAGLTATPAGPDAVHLQWAAPVASTELPLSGYYVERVAGPATGPACGSSPTALLAAGRVDCDDTGLEAGSYTYRVTAVYRTFTAGATTPVTVGPSALTTT